MPVIAPDPEAVDVWNAWLTHVEPTLRSGLEVIVPGGMPAPARAGFQQNAMAEPWGQSADWTCSLPDGSRLHLHELPHGTLIAHIDAIDPKRGPVRAVIHWSTESASGRAALFSLSLWFVLRQAAAAAILR